MTTTTDNPLTKIQEEYFEFFLTLLQKLSVEENDIVALSTKAYYLKNELKKEITNHLLEHRGEAVKAIEEKIEELRTELQNLSPDMSFKI